MRRGLVDGARATLATPSVAASFLALAAHRLAFGIGTLLTLLLFRYAFTDAGPIRSGLAGVGEAVAAGAAGLGVAALLTPWMVHHLGRPRTIQIGLLISVVAQLALAALLSAPAVLAVAFVLGATGQMIKLCTDAAVQGEIADELLGRVFALYDIVFNVGYVIAVAAAALLSPPDGRAPGLLAGAAAALRAGPAGSQPGAAPGRTAGSGPDGAGRVPVPRLTRRSPRPRRGVRLRLPRGSAGRVPCAAPAGACRPARPAGPGRCRAAA